MFVSVVICTHNPRKPVLRRVLDGLQAQTLPLSEWELCIIDNCSTEFLVEKVDISWHGLARVVRENQLGLTNARLRGFLETTGDLVVLVDDDNVLDPTYLVQARELAIRHSNIGVFGGSIIGEFETSPPQWLSQFEFDLLGVRPIDSDYWSNLPWFWQTSPIGAGMVIRRAVCDAYTNVVSQNSVRVSLDRRGQSLVSGGDSDIAATACSCGFGVGRFACLKANHVLPQERLTERYLVELAEAIGFSQAILERIHQGGTIPSVGRMYSLLTRALDEYRMIRLEPHRRRVQNAFRRGKKRARETPLGADGNLHA